MTCIEEERLLFSAQLKPRGYYLEHFWQADLGYIGQAIIGVKVPNSSHVACIQHGRVPSVTGSRVLDNQKLPICANFMLRFLRQSSERTIVQNYCWLFYFGFEI